MTGEIALDPASRLRERLNSILDTPLTLDVESYASNALDQLIGLANEAVAAMPAALAGAQANNRDREDSALQYFGLGDLGSILDYVSTLADRIKAIGNRIEMAEIGNDVMLPPDPGRILQQTGGAETYDAPQMRQLVKVILLVLSEELTVDVDDISITQGRIGANMMRKQPYVRIDVDAINRTIFVCDESNNATFIFDTRKLAEHHLTEEDLSVMTKEELKDLIAHHARIGRRLPFTKRFVEQLSEALTDLAAPQRTPQRESGRYLRPKEDGPNDDAALGRRMSYSKAIVQWAAAQLGESLGPVQTTIHRGQHVVNYSPEQESIIRQWLQKYKSKAPRIPQGFLSHTALAESLRCPNPNLTKYARLTPDLGKVDVYLTGSTLAFCYSPEQQKQIKSTLVALGKQLERLPFPDDITAAQAIMSELQITREILARLIQGIGPERFGGIRRYTSYEGYSERGFTPEQRQLIYEAYQDIKPKDDELNAIETAEALGIGRNTWLRVFQALAGQLRDVRTAVKNGHSGPVYNSQHRAIIEQWLVANGYREKIPEGTTSAYLYAVTQKIAYPTLKMLIEKAVAEGNMPEPRPYWFTTKSQTLGLTSSDLAALQPRIDQWKADHEARQSK